MSYSSYTPSRDIYTAIIRCPHTKCHARIIKPAGKHVIVEQLATGLVFITPEESVESDDKFIQIGDVWDFDNIGVSKEFQDEKLTGVDRVLICSECDRGPIGFVRDNVYYLSLKSVVYE